MATLIIMIFLAVFLLPFFVKTVEENLESFIFMAGLFAALVSGVLTRDLLREALLEPLPITIAVLSAGLLFKWFQGPIRRQISRAAERIPPRLLTGLVVIVLGLVSSLITAVIAALILVTVVETLSLKRRDQLWFVVLTCFAIGLGAVLTPIGEPLATIATYKLGQDFWFLLHLLGPYVIPGILGLGILGSLTVHPQKTTTSRWQRVVYHSENYPEILARGIYIYAFVMGLTFLGAAFEPFLAVWIGELDAKWLYWVNIVSAAVDNATLTAAELNHALTPEQVKLALMGLLLSGGMLIPGNIPNIVAANKLSITSREWAHIGLPVGLAIMLLYFILLMAFPGNVQP